MLTETEALAQGYTVDRHARIAYRGPRFAPTTVVGLYTEREAAMREALQAYERLWIEREGVLGELSPELRAVRAQAARAMR